MRLRMKKQRRPKCKDPFTVSYADLSSGLDRKLRVLGELCSDTDPDTLNPEVVPELGSIVLEYLQDRLALEHAAYERTVPGLLGNDDALWEKVAIFQKRLRRHE